MANIPANINFVIQSGLATLHDLKTVYDLGDMWLLMESAMVKNHNERAYYAEVRRK